VLRGAQLAGSRTASKTIEEERFLLSGGALKQLENRPAYAGFF
jgi:hypothetical protein